MQASRVRPYQWLCGRQELAADRFRREARDHRGIRGARSAHREAVWFRKKRHSPRYEVHAGELCKRHQRGKPGSTSDEWQRGSILVADQADNPVHTLFLERLVRGLQEEKRRTSAPRPSRHSQVDDLSDDDLLVSRSGLSTECRHGTGEPFALEGQKGAKHTAKAG